MKTVAAISTPYGKGGVAMIRITGENAFEVTSKVFALKSGKSLLLTAPNTAVYGSFFDKDGVFDDGLVTLFRAPKSFTGEDTAELCCHGGILVTKKLLEAVITAGADYAEAGEFTKRAFINGKITLSQAEAVGGIIDARNESHLAVSILQSKGALTEKIKALSDSLALLAASVYAFIDYPDEDLTDVPVEEMKDRLIQARNEVLKLIDSHRYGKAISEGINTVIVGKPNTGKSSLLNSLIGFERAIVTDIAGTTRDIVTEQIRLGDIVLNISDTAGIRESEDIIEKIGIGKSKKALEEAELVLAVFDASKPLDEEDRYIIGQINKAGKSESTVCILNKKDIGFFEPDINFKRKVMYSAVDSEGRDELEKTLSEMFGQGEINSMGEIIVSARQFASLNKALSSLDSALLSLEGFTQDIAGMDIEHAIASLGELDGRLASEQVVNEIFSHFCVGK